MKVLVVCIPGAGHVNPLVPLVSALTAGGDDVVVATGEMVRDTVEKTGATLYPAGEGQSAWFGRLAARTRGIPGDGLPPQRIEHYFVPRLFAEVAAADMIDDALQCGRVFGPDVVIFDTEAFAGPLVAELLGVPAVHHLLGPLLDADVLQLATDALSPLWRAFGGDVPEHAGLYSGLSIGICPPILETRTIPAGELQALRPVQLPVPAADKSSRPLVHLTLGTVNNGDLGVFRTVLNGLASEPLDLIVAVGPGNDPADLDPVPANARVVQYVPHASLLPRCAAVIHHGGAGTMFGALAHGLPQVVIPQGADNFTNAAILRAAQLATVLLPGEVTAASVRDAVRTALDAPKFAMTARRAASEIAAMPSAVHVADLLRDRYGPRQRQMQW